MEVRVKNLYLKNSLTILIRYVRLLHIKEVNINKYSNIYKLKELMVKLNADTNLYKGGLKLILA